LLEVLGSLGDLLREAAQLGGSGSIVSCGDDVFGGTAELEEAVLQGGDFGVGEDDGVFGEAAALQGGAAFVGALAAGLPAVAAATSDVAAFGEAPAAPATVLRGGVAARDGEGVDGRLRLFGEIPHPADPSWPPRAHAGVMTEVHTDGMRASFPYLADPLPRAFAHRGWHLDELSGLENSLPAFKRACAEGYRYLETDVHATSDGVVVVHHDASLDRTTDGAGPIATQTWAQLKDVKVGGKAPLSRLEDVLEELPEARFNIDVKANQAVEPFVRVLERTGAHDRVAAASFSDARLARLRRLAGPKLATAMGPRSAFVLWTQGRLPLLPLGRLVLGAMAQVPVRQGALRVVDKAFVAMAGRAGIEVHTWTIDDPAEMRMLLDLGVHGIVTDRPDLLRDVLVERGTWPLG
jgi:glycerophosphoryl diester phosphodiesterase